MTEPRHPSVSYDCDEAVILIHGMLAGARSMSRIGRALGDVGLDVVYWNYPTLSGSLRTHGQRLAETIRGMVARRNLRKLHFATHSMGAIVLRVALQAVEIPNGSRAVMLAPPNAGSRLTRLPMGPFASWFPQLVELSESPDSLVNQLPEPTGIDVGIVAATRDTVVDVESTRLSSQRDHLVLPTTHQKLPNQREAIEQVQYFLAHGTFLRTSPFGAISKAA